MRGFTASAGNGWPDAWKGSSRQPTAKSTSLPSFPSPPVRDTGVDGVASELPEEIFGVNDRVQLAQVEAVMQWQVIERLMRSGVTAPGPRFGLR